METIKKQIGEFTVSSLDALNIHELYEILRARADVFVGELHILYPDADGIDYESLHVFSLGDDGKVTGYLRMFNKEDEENVVQIGRVLTREHGHGLGRKLLDAGISAAGKYMGAREIYAEAQKHAVGFYLKDGFEITSGEFIEAGIPHMQVRRKLR